MNVLVADKLSVVPGVQLHIHHRDTPVRLDGYTSRVLRVHPVLGSTKAEC